MGSRRLAREMALEVLYQVDLCGGEAMASAMNLFEEKQARPEVRRYARHLINGVLNHRDELDERIVRAADNWRIGRLAAIDRTVLRIGVYEMFHSDDVPPKVAINESIEIVKCYSTAESGHFVNAVLDKIRHQAQLGVD